MLEIMVMSSFVGVGLFVVLLSEAASVSGNIMVYNDNTSQLVAEYRDMPARFGSIVSPEGIQAMLVYADPPDACNPIARPPQSAIIGGAMQWAVLIKRCNCSFYQKVKNAQDANYSIAIVHNVGSDELEPMAEDKHGVPIYIVAVFIGERAGNHLKERYLYKQSYFIELNNDYPFIIDNLLWPFALVVGLCFFLMLGFMVGVVVKCIKDRRRAQRRRLPYSSLKQIPTSKFHKGDPYETCAICLEDFVEGEKLRVLPCSHAYHSKCIDPWLTRKRRVCPVCKRKVFAADEVPQPASLSDSDADSDMDADDHTHLIRPRGMQTDGGTFSINQQNPLLRGGAGRQQQQRRHSSSSSASSSASSSDGVQPLGEVVARLIAEYEVEARNSRQAGEEGGEGGRRANEEEGGGREVSLPINASIDDHQELPAVVAGTSGSYQESSNSSAISSLWKSWKR